MKKQSAQKLFKRSVSLYQAQLPQPRLPRLLVMNSLKANSAVYPRIDLDVPGASNILTLSSGATAQVINLGTSTQIPNWSTRLQTLFDEYCIVGFKIGIRQLVSASGNGGGYMMVGLDEKSNTAPTLAGMQSTPHIEIPVLGSATIASEQPIHWINWMARDYTDLVFTSTATTGTPVFLKFFASNAGTGTSASGAATFEIFGSYAIAFRGYTGT